MGRCVGLWGVREALSELLYVWVWMCLCVWECVHVGVRVLTTPTEEKQPLLAGLFSSYKLLSKPGNDGQAVVRFLQGGGQNRADGREGGRQASRPAGTPRPTLLWGTPAGDRPPGSE